MRYAAAVTLMLLGFAWAEWNGFTFGGPGRAHPPAPASVRSSPGGYRSHTFWHTGFHGGK